MRPRLDGLFRGSMRGRTMYVIPYLMSPAGNALERWAAGVELTIDAGQSDSDFAGVHVGEIAEGIGSGDVFKVFGVARGGEGRRVALALALHFELFEFVDARGEIEIPRRGLVGGDGDGGVTAGGMLRREGHGSGSQGEEGAVGAAQPRRQLAGEDRMSAGA